MKRIAIFCTLAALAVAGCANVSDDSRDVVLPDGSHHPACAIGPRGILGCSLSAIDAFTHPGIGPGDPRYGLDRANMDFGTGTSYGARVLAPYGAGDGAAGDENQ